MEHKSTSCVRRYLSNCETQLLPCINHKFVKLQGLIYAPGRQVLCYPISSTHAYFVLVYKYVTPRNFLIKIRDAACDLQPSCHTTPY